MSWDQALHHDDQCGSYYVVEHCKLTNELIWTRQTCYSLLVPAILIVMLTLLNHKRCLTTVTMIIGSFHCSIPLGNKNFKIQSNALWIYFSIVG